MSRPMRSLRDVWGDLGSSRYRSQAPPHGYPVNMMRLWAPIDHVHDAIVACARAASISLSAAMYGWDDAEINEIFLWALRNEQLPVSLSLDSSQAAGKGEVPLVKEWREQIGNSLAIGRSSRGAISHLKTIVVDGLLSIGGSTNLSVGGENKQNNELVIVWDAVYAAETRARLDVIHDEMLMQMQRA